MPKAPLSQLKLEAAALASQLGTLSTSARAASTAHLGSARRRRPGSGEDFWQYRPHVAEDGAQRVDWRRSAREEHLYVREMELETSRTFLFWVDPSEGFNWTSDEKRIVAKSDRALVLSMALAGALSRSGERCGVLGAGRPAVSGARAPIRVGEDSFAMTPDFSFPGAPRETAAVLVASDFYEPLETWRARLKPVAAKCRDGVLLQVCDPIEASYPFSGRVKFFRPGETRLRLVGKAESVRDDYLARFEQRRADLVDLAAEYGWRFVSHTTDHDPKTPLGEIAIAFSTAGVAA